MSVITTPPSALIEAQGFGFVQPTALPPPIEENTSRKFWPRIPEFEVIDPDRAGMLLRAQELERKRSVSKRLRKLPTQILASLWKQITKLGAEGSPRQHKQPMTRVRQDSPQIEGKRTLTNLALNPASAGSSFRRVWHSIERLVQTHQARKRLRLCETISLGEKRFIAVVQVDGKQLLVGGATNGLSVLANLESSSTFSNLLQRRLEEGTQA
jgi:hypothetical protein